MYLTVCVVVGFFLQSLLEDFYGVCLCGFTTSLNLHRPNSTDCTDICVNSIYRKWRKVSHCFYHRFLVPPPSLVTFPLVSLILLLFLCLLSVCPQATHFQVFSWQAATPLSNFLLPIAMTQRAKLWCMWITEKRMEGMFEPVLFKAGGGWALCLPWQWILPLPSYKIKKFKDFLNEKH